ncbi:MAG TPA: CheR family methyltransferase [Noviherbaspirillum sp.]
MNDITLDVEDLEIDLLLEAVFRRYGHDYRRYRRAPIRDRLRAVMRNAGLQTVSALQDRVIHDPASARALLRALSERPVGLFEDADYFHALRAAMVPLLRSYPSSRVWVAECVSAEDVGALSIVLAEEQLHDKTQIFATAESEVLLEEARSGCFPRERLAEYEENYRRSGGKESLAAYCVQEDGSAAFSGQLRSNITWAQHSLATDASFNEFQLILCRRALSDYGDGLRRQVLQLFYDSMSYFGVLSVNGGAHVNAAPFVGRYAPIAEEQGLYRRVA